MIESIMIMISFFVALAVLALVYQMTGPRAAHFWKLRLEGLKYDGQFGEVWGYW